MTTLNPEQIAAIEQMVQRRMAATGETRSQAARHISNYLQSTTNQYQ